MGDGLGEVYQYIGIMVGMVVFVTSWFYCVTEYGYMWGLGLGWLPSIFAALLAGWAWPLVVIGLIWRYWPG